jgi:broad-specificity NMP kinase
MYLIDGVSGAGKTTICEELSRRGYNAVEADEVLAGFIDPTTGLPTDDHSSENWHWDKEKFRVMVAAGGDKDIFVCGGAMNKPDFLHHFTKVFTLHLDDETLKRRLLHRTNNDYGKKPEELAFQLKMNADTVQYSKENGTILIDATQPVSVIIDQILKNIA